MRYRFSARSRHSDGKPISKKHADLMQRWKKLSPPWGLRGETPLPESDSPPGCEYLSLKRNIIAKVIKATLLYSNRELTEDDGSCDDNITIDFDSNKVDYRSAIHTLCSSIIEWFDCYLAQIKEDSIVLADVDSSAADSNSRTSVQRISPVCFFDATLCKRAFGKTPGALMKLLKPHVESTQMLGDGIFIIVTSEPVGPEETNAIDRRLRPLLIKA